MIWSLAILPAVFMTDAALRVYAQTRVLLLLNAIRLGVIVVLIHWAITTFHLTGAVMLTLAAAVLTKGLALVRVARVMHVRPGALVPWASVGGIVLAATVAGVIARLVLSGLSWPALPALMMTAGVYASVYVGLLWLCGVMTVTNNMCGIAGIVSLGERGVDVSELQAMCGAMVHRGPNSGGAYVGPGVATRHATPQRDRLADRQPADRATKTVPSGWS